MRILWQLVHHIIAHPIVGLSFDMALAWKFHDWTAIRAWPDEFKPSALSGNQK